MNEAEIFKEAARLLRESNDNPDLARGGSVAAFLEQMSLATTKWRPVVFETENTEGYGVDMHMTRQDFLDSVHCGAFIDYDGHGELATETECSNLNISPSDVDDFLWPEWATHVVWYNK